MRGDVFWLVFILGLVIDLLFFNDTFLYAFLSSFFFALIMAIWY